MSQPRKKEWIFVENGCKALRCERCGERLEMPLPINLEIGLAMMKAFGKVHRRCQERKVEVPA